MQSVMMRVSARSRETLRELTTQTGESMQSMIDEAVELYRRRRFLEAVNAAYTPLRQHAETWTVIEHERREWDTALGDGLQHEQTGTGSEHNRRERKNRSQATRPRRGLGCESESEARTWAGRPAPRCGDFRRRTQPGTGRRTVLHTSQLVLLRLPC